MEKNPAGIGTAYHNDRTESRVFEAELQPAMAPWPALPVPDNTPLQDEWQEDAAPSPTAKTKES